MKITDCPHRPGTPEHNAWVNEVYIPWQRCDPETVVRAEADHAAAQQMWRDMEAANPARVAADGIMREVANAVRHEPTFGLDWSPLLGYVIVNANARPFADEVERMTQQLKELAETWTRSVPVVRFDKLFCAGFKPAPIVSRRTSGRTVPRRRTPAPPAARCHHSNPRNACRDCSMGRR